MKVRKNISHWNITVKDLIEFLREMNLNYISHHPMYKNPTEIYPNILSQKEGSGVRCRQNITINLIENDEIKSMDISSVSEDILVDIPKEIQEYHVIAVRSLHFDEYFFHYTSNLTFRNGTTTTLTIDCKRK